MDRITVLADLSIRRACGFAGLGVGTTMAAMSFDLLLCLRVGAILTTMIALVLWAQAQGARHRNVRRTELWMMLGGRIDLPRARAQQLLGNVLRDRYLWHATVAAALAGGLWLAAGLILLVRQL